MCRLRVLAEEPVDGYLDGGLIGHGTDVAMNLTPGYREVSVISPVLVYGKMIARQEPPTENLAVAFVGLMVGAILSLRYRLMSTKKKERRMKR